MSISRKAACNYMKKIANSEAFKIFINLFFLKKKRRSISVPEASVIDHVIDN
jgi:hypothetical protein